VVTEIGGKRRPPGGGAAPGALTLAAWLEEGRRGVVEVQGRGRGCRLQLADGRLSIASGETVGGGDGSSVDVEQLIAVLGGATAEGLLFSPRPVGAATGRSLPTARLLMEAAVRERDRAQLWHQIGGRTAVLRMGGDSTVGRDALAAIDPGLQALLARFVKPRRATDLVGDDDSGLETLRDLARLRAVGLLANAPSHAESDRAALTEKSKDLFLHRIAGELERRPLRIAPADHRRQIVELLRNLGVWNHYELLRVDRHQDDQAIHQAYVELARLTHPAHAETLDLEGKGAALELLFEAATEAYLVLSHPDRRREYDRDLGPDQGGAASEERRREKASVARDMYLRAQRMAVLEQHQDVLELMQQAVLLDPQAEYYALLGQVQRRNPRWKSGAVASYRNAVRCRPNDADLRLVFGQVLDEAGDHTQAGVQYRAALEIRPGDVRIQRALDSLADLPEEEEKGGLPRPGLLASLLALFRREKPPAG
jgi:hypothetical protein